MLRFLLGFIFLTSFPTISLAQDIEFSKTDNLKSFMRQLRTKTRAIEKIRDAESAKLEKQYNRRLNEIQDAAIGELELMQKRVAAEDLSKAIEIRDAVQSIDDLQNEEVENEVSAPKDQPSVVVLREKSDGKDYLWALLPGGRAITKNPKFVVKWRSNGNQISIIFKSGNNWTLVRDKDGNFSGTRAKGATGSFEHVYGSLDFLKQ